MPVFEAQCSACGSAQFAGMSDILPRIRVPIHSSFRALRRTSPIAAMGCAGTTQHLQMLDRRFNRWASASSAAYHSGVRGWTSSRPAALVVAEPVVLGSSDLARWTTRLGLERSGSLSAAPLPQPSGATLDCTDISGAGPVAQLANSAQNRETTTRRMNTRKPPVVTERYHAAWCLSR
jgi:hypothetical protein